jgi:cytochrome c
MKQTLLCFFFAALLASCGNNTGKSAADKKTTPSAADSEADKGLALVASNGCYTCHQVDQPGAGPAYTAVAARYPNNDQVIDSLAQKIIKGGSGNWGTIPMIPHPGVSQEDARTMVKYVLSLKK